jgi:hypothetical protein
MSENPNVATAWPSGDSMPVLAIKLTLDELSQRYPLEVFRDRDDLDGFTGAIVQSAPCGPLLIMRHDNSPDELTAFYVDSAQVLEVAQSSIVQMFGINDDEIAWLRGTPS